MPNAVHTAMLPLRAEHPGICFAHLYNTQYLLEVYGVRVLSHTCGAHFTGGKESMPVFKKQLTFVGFPVLC